MKKTLSLLLSLAMMLSMVPAVAAAPAEEAEAPEAIVEELSAEDIARQNKAKAEAQMARDEARMEAALTADDELVEFPEMDALDATYYDVTLNVTLPQKATSGDLRGYMTMVPTKLADGQVLDDAGMYGNAMDATGAKTVSFDIRVPAGEFIPTVYSYANGSGSYSNTYIYFNADGTVAANEFVATPITINSDKTINITMPAAERTLGGTVKFSSPLKATTWFEADARSNSSFTNNYARCEIEVPKGATEFDFELGLPVGSYYMELTCSGNDTYNYKYGYCDVYGGLSNEYDDYTHFSLFGGSEADLVIDGDVLLTEAGPGQEWDGTDVQVTVDLPETAAAWQQYMILIYDTEYPDEPYDYSWVNAQKDSTSISAWFGVEKDTKFKVAYVDSENASFNWRDVFAAPRFAGDDGVTSLMDNAAEFTAAGETMEVTIDDTDNYKLTGTIKLGDPCTTDYQAVYALAAFPNDEVFGARVGFWSGDDSAQYTMYIPKHMSGSFDLSAAHATSGYRMSIQQDTAVNGGSHTVKNGLSLSAITMPAAPKNFKGTVSLPEGMTAPKGGLAVQLEAYYDVAGTYLIAEGESSVDFALAVTPNEDEYLSVAANVLNAPADLFNTIRIDNLDPADLSNVDFQLVKAVTLSGNVTVPEVARELGTTFDVYTNSSWGYTAPNDYENGSVYINNRVYLTTLPGDTSAAYALKVPAGIETRVYARVQADATGRVLATNMYLQNANGTTAVGSKTITLTKDVTANFAFSQGKTITGKVTLVDGLPAGDYHGTVYAQTISTQGGSTSYNASFNFSGSEGTYSLAVPYDYTGTYRVWVNAYSDDTDLLLSGTNLYWSESGMTTDRSMATPVTASEEGTQVDLQLLKALSASGQITMDPSIVLENGWLSGNVYLEDDFGDRYSSYFDFNDGRDYYNIKLPTGYTGTYKLMLRYNFGTNNSGVSTPEGLLTYTYLYMTDTGWTTNPDDAKLFTVDGDGLVQDIVIPKGTVNKLTINAPAGMSGDYRGTLYLTNSVTDERDNYSYEFSGTSGQISITTVPGDTGTYYAELYMYEGPGILRYQTYYYTGIGWSKYESDGSAFTLDELSNLTMPAGKTITGKLVSSTGEAIYLGEDPSCGISLQRSGTGYSSSINGVTSTMDQNGNFVVTFPEDTTGSAVLYVRPDQATGSNVVTDKNYYYVAGAESSVYDRDSATSIDLTESTSGIEIMVDTGYILSGTISLGEGAILTDTNPNSDPGNTVGTVTISLNQIVADNESDYKNYYCGVSLTNDATSWTYSMVVPKEASSYMMYVEQVYISFDDGVETNLFDGRVEIGSLPVTGNGTLPAVALKPAKSIITVDLTCPDSFPLDEWVYGDVYVMAGENTYDASFNGRFRDGVSTQVMLPDTEPATTYKVYYSLSYNDKLFSNKNIYLAADGSMTRDVEQAAEFPMQASASHTLALQEIPPYHSGKIYLPGYTDEELQISVCGYNNNYTYYDVNSSTVKTDENGQKYIDYALTNSNIAGSDYEYSYGLLFQASPYTSSSPWLSNQMAIAEDGSYVLYNDYSSNRKYFTASASKFNTFDITLPTWDYGSEKFVFQSEHGFTNPTTSPSYSYTVPGATSFYVTFSRLTDVGVLINGETAYTYGSDTYQADANGTITFTYDMNSFNSYYTGLNYGFAVTSITPYFYGSASEPTQPTLNAVYTGSGNVDTTEVMDTVKSGETVHVSVNVPDASIPSTPEYVATGTLFVPVYDANGKMIDLTIQTVELRNGTVSTNLGIDEEVADAAATMKLMMLIDQYFAPVMQSFEF